MEKAGLDLEQQIRARCRIVKLPAGTRLYEPGQTPSDYVLLRQGQVVVRQYSASGRVIVLYRLKAGETCVLTTSCLIGAEDYPAEAVAETPIEAALMSRSSFEELLALSAEFRRFVFDGFGHRIAALFRLIEEIAFTPLHVRLAEKLLDLSPSGEEIRISQKDLAEELGGSREAVNRGLGDFRRLGHIDLARARIRVLDRTALRHICEAAQ
jgi:CRP/FNR family transcriptional regulator